MELSCTYCGKLTCSSVDNVCGFCKIEDEILKQKEHKFSGRVKNRENDTVVAEFSFSLHIGLDGLTHKELVQHVQTMLQKYIDVTFWNEERPEKIYNL